MGVDEFGRFRLAGNSVEMDVKKKRTTAKVQVTNHEPVEVVLSQNCSSVAEHASFLQEKINQSQGNLLDLDLVESVGLRAIFVDNMALMDHDIQLDPESQYTFRFNLVHGIGNDRNGQSDNGPNQMEELATKVDQLAAEKDEQNEKHAEIMENQQKQMKAMKEKLAELKEKQAKDREKVEQQLALASHNDEALPMEEMAALKGRVDELEKKAQMAEYAQLIGVPDVTNLEENYNREKLLQLIRDGNGLTKSLYIQEDQAMDDQELLQCIVDLLASTEKPEKMIGEVTIECYQYVFFDSPKNVELKLKQKRNGAIKTYAKAEADRFSAEYELVNSGYCFQVTIHYAEHVDFNKWVKKFVYSRLA